MVIAIGGRAITMRGAMQKRSHEPMYITNTKDGAKS